MADNTEDRGPQDRSRINTEQQHEVRYWSERFGVTEAELRRAIRNVGPMVKDVAQQLGRRA